MRRAGQYKPIEPSGIFAVFPEYAKEHKWVDWIPIAGFAAMACKDESRFGPLEAPVYFMSNFIYHGIWTAEALSLLPPL